jgi:hypothetical protein
MQKNAAQHRVNPTALARVAARGRARHGATGRPDTLLRALDLADLPRRCTRLRLILEEEEEA